MSSAATVPCMVIVSLLIFAPLLALSIVSIVIGSQHQDTTCDQEAVVLLSSWLIVYGATGLGFVVAFLVLGAGFYFTKGVSLVLLLIFLVLYNLFTIAWNIIGAVSLFRDSMDCKQEERTLWNMTLAVLIIQWVGIVLSCTAGKAKDSN